MSIRIDKKEALRLFDKNLLELGSVATDIRNSHKDSSIVTFVVDRNINYTNVCACKCKFCAFYKDRGCTDSYTLTNEQILTKTRELVNIGGTQLLLQGGLNSDLKLDYYFEIISSLRKNFPQLDIHAFSPPELNFISTQNKISVQELLQELIKCGLSSIPGAGAEILQDNIRSNISPDKISAQKWLDIMKIAHLQGLKSTATMVAGLGETNSDIIEHLDKIRELQDETGGFSAFIPWTFQPANTKLTFKKLTANDYLKTLAISRIYLDNVKNIQTSWVTQGVQVAQLSLFFGSNDFGGTMMEENVVRAAGITNYTTKEEIVDIIKYAGFTPAKRNTQYKILKIY